MLIFAGLGCGLSSSHPNIDDIDEIWGLRFELLFDWFLMCNFCLSRCECDLLLSLHAVLVNAHVGVNLLMKSLFYSLFVLLKLKLINKSV